MLPSFAHVRPDTLDQALTLLGRGSARAQAGGTDLLGCLRDGALPPVETLVSLGAIGEMHGFRPGTDGGIRLGALTTISELATNQTVRSSARALADAAASVASPQLRNQGTLGGNLLQKPRCWYYRGDFDCLRKGGDTCFAYDGENRYHCIFGGSACYIVHPSDTAPALVALGASARIASPRARRTVPVEQLHVAPADDPTRESVLEPDEILVEVMLPEPGPGLRSSYRKVRARASWDFALVGVALALHLDGKLVRRASVVLSGVAPIPWRAKAVEQVLEGSTLDAATIKRAAAAAITGAEPLAQNGYKIPLLEGLVTEQLETILTQE